MHVNIYRNLDNRLALTASLVRRGSRLADIGTDHAYVPVWLVGQAACPSAIATDIRKGPAERAAQTIAMAGLSDRIAVRLGDGLSPVKPEETDDIVIAGMGGENIAAILAAAPWTKDGRVHLVLQPMSKQEILREYLLTNGFALQEEHVAVTGSHLYIVMSARYEPETAAEQRLIPAVFYRGIFDAEEGGLYLSRQRQRLFKEAGALRQAGELQKAENLFKIAEALD